MKLIKVKYTINEEFITKNKKNVEAVMEALRNLKRNDVKYSYYQSKDDPKTFMHIVSYLTEEAESYPSSLPEFKTFQNELKQNLETPPQVESFDLLASSSDK